MTKAQRKRELRSKYRCTAVCSVIILGTALFLVALPEPEPMVGEQMEIETEYDLIRWKDESTEGVSVEPLEEVVVEAAEPEKETQESTYISLGEFKLTAYCSCEKCCGKWAKDRPVDENGNEIVIGSEGTVLEPLRSIAVDTDVIPYGTVVMIYDRAFIAQDTGGSVKGNHIDIYFENHEDTIALVCRGVYI